MGCTSKESESTDPIISGKYFGQKEPTLRSELFAPGIISTGMSEINAVYSPDYSEFFYTIILPDEQLVIMTMSYKNKKWSEPEVATFSGEYSDADPFISYDGKWLYFISKRPVDNSQKEKKDWDIWRLKKEDGAWSNLEKLGPDINSETNDIYPALTKSGTLYYSSGKDGDKDNNDLFYAKSNGNNFETSVKLNDKINPHWEGDVFVSPDEDYMIFFVSHKQNEKSGLYISFNENKIWAEPQRMKEDINRTGREFCPIVSPDGKFFFFTSNRKIEKENSKQTLSYRKIKEDFTALHQSPGNGKNDVYWVDAKVIEEYRDKSN